MTDVDMHIFCDCLPDTHWRNNMHFRVLWLFGFAQICFLVPVHWNSCSWYTFNIPLVIKAVALRHFNDVQVTRMPEFWAITGKMRNKSWHRWKLMQFITLVVILICKSVALCPFNDVQVTRMPKIWAVTVELSIYL